MASRSGRTRREQEGPTVYIKRVHVERDICTAVVVGEFELGEAERQFIELIDEAVLSGATKVLIDGRQMTGSPNSFERFLYGTFAACATLEALHKHNASLRFAYVIHEPLRDPKRYGESVAATMGMDVKTFDDENDAVEWLKGKE